MPAKAEDIQATVIKEDDGSYSIMCKALGVFSAGATLEEAESNYREALELHLSVLREDALNKGD